jgi:hypothetical protein
METPREPEAAIPAMPPPAPTVAIEIPLVPEAIDVAAIDSLASDTAPTPSAPLAAPLAATQYTLQRRRMKKTQLTLAIVMLVAVIVLAAVLVWVIRISSSPTGAASIPTTTRPATVDLGRRTYQSEAT